MRELARGLGILLALTSFARCTRLLEIDGDYTLAPAGRIAMDASEGATGGRRAIDSGVSSGNAPLPDGSAMPDQDAAAADSAAPEADALRSDCLPGLYAGTMEGIHSPSFTVVAVPLPVSGTVSLRMELVADDRLSFEGNFDGGLSGTTLQAISGSLKGEINCVTLEVEHGTLEGLLAGIPLTGTFQGRLLDKQLEGTWQETEPDPQFSGEGTATLTWSSP